MKRRTFLRGLVVFAVLCIPLGSVAQENPSTVKQRFNIPMPTMGGKQLWADVTIYGGWRIQQHVYTEHYRLLSPRDVRRAWGTLAQCQSALNEAKAKGKARLRSKKACVLIHGYGRSKDSMKGLKKGLETANYEVYAINYPSTRFDIDTFAKQVRALLEDMQGDFQEINVVTHSMGGIVARRVFSQEDAPKIHRLVMFAPPNQGAVLADMLLEWWPSEHVAGPAAKQLATNVESLARNAGIPRCEFGVIAGQRGHAEGWNPLIPGDDDGVVGVENTKLEGMADFALVRGIHTTIMNKEEAIRKVLAFLKQGVFDSTRRSETEDNRK